MQKKGSGEGYIWISLMLFYLKMTKIIHLYHIRCTWLKLHYSLVGILFVQKAFATWTRTETKTCRIMSFGQICLNLNYLEIRTENVLCITKIQPSRIAPGLPKNVCRPPGCCLVRQMASPCLFVSYLRTSLFHAILTSDKFIFIFCVSWKNYVKPKQKMWK